MPQNYFPHSNALAFRVQKSFTTPVPGQTVPEQKALNAAMTENDVKFFPLAD